jgi:hypothetical protein
MRALILLSTSKEVDVASTGFVFARLFLPILADALISMIKKVSDEKSLTVPIQEGFKCFLLLLVNNTDERLKYRSLSILVVLTLELLSQIPKPFESSESQQINGLLSTSLVQLATSQSQMKSVMSELTDDQKSLLETTLKQAMSLQSSGFAAFGSLPSSQETPSIQLKTFG